MTHDAVREDCQTEYRYVVRRERMVEDLMERGRQAGIVMLYAPDGFGKTSILMQYADGVRAAAGRGGVKTIEAAGAVFQELMVQLEYIEDELAMAAEPLVVIDNVPSFAADETAQLVARLRQLRDEGCELLLSCLPSNRALVHALGDSIKVNAQGLRVQPREYAEWAHTYSIDNSLDVYELTQGIPALVAALQATVERPIDGKDVLDQVVTDVVGGVLGDLVRIDASYLRAAYLMLLVGEGSIAELERCGVRVAEADLAALRRDYAVFGLDPSDGRFTCLGTEGGARKIVREAIVGMRPDLLVQAVRIHMKAGRVDKAVALLRQFPDEVVSTEIIREFPVDLALAGHALFLEEALGRRVQEMESSGLEVNAVLALYVAALTVGDIKLAKRAARELSARADEVEREVRGSDWAIACACAGMWGSNKGLELPAVIGPDGLRGSTAVHALRVHGDVLVHMTDGRGWPGLPDVDVDSCDATCAVSVVDVLMRCDRLLVKTLQGHADACEAREAPLRADIMLLRERKLVSMRIYAEAILGLRSLIAGTSTDGDRVFTEAENMAIRSGNLDLQLFFLLWEGWQSLTSGQVVSAQFRASQILKLSTEDRTLLREAASLLAKTAYLRSTSQVKIRDEAEMLDLAMLDASPATTWAMALHLAVAKRDSELSVWYSLHKRELLESAIKPFACMALRELGDRADAIRRVMPPHLVEDYVPSRGNTGEVRLFDVEEPDRQTEIGQISIGLFGGFCVERNGHVLTDAIWKRKRCGVLMARLALASGSFVSRKTLTEEFWPTSEYMRARENLYVTASALKRALGQAKGGPQYILSQGEGLAINTEFVVSDVARFMRLARMVMLSHTAMAAPQIIETCLKMEELYKGELYAPLIGDTTYFSHMRAEMKGKFVNSMERGIGLAIEENDLSAAAWMLAAAIKEDPLNDGLMEYRLQLDALNGRRRPQRRTGASRVGRRERSMELIEEHDKGVTVR